MLFPLLFNARSPPEVVFCHRLIRERKTYAQFYCEYHWYGECTTPYCLEQKAYLRRASMQMRLHIFFSWHQSSLIVIISTIWIRPFLLGINRFPFLFASLWSNITRRFVFIYRLPTSLHGKPSKTDRFLLPNSQWLATMYYLFRS